MYRPFSLEQFNRFHQTGIGTWEHTCYTDGIKVRSVPLFYHRSLSSPVKNGHRGILTSRERVFEALSE